MLFLFSLSLIIYYHILRNMSSTYYAICKYFYSNQNATILLPFLKPRHEKTPFLLIKSTNSGFCVSAGGVPSHIGHVQTYDSGFIDSYAVFRDVLKFKNGRQKSQKKTLKATILLPGINCSIRGYYQSAPRLFSSVLQLRVNRSLL